MALDARTERAALERALPAADKADEIANADVDAAADADAERSPCYDSAGGTEPGLPTPAAPSSQLRGRQPVPPLLLPAHVEVERGRREKAPAYARARSLSDSMPDPSLSPIAPRSALDADWLSTPYQRAEVPEVPAETLARAAGRSLDGERRSSRVRHVGDPADRTELRSALHHLERVWRGSELGAEEHALVVRREEGDGAARGAARQGVTRS